MIPNFVPRARWRGHAARRVVATLLFSAALGGAIPLAPAHAVLAPVANNDDRFASSEADVIAPHNGSVNLDLLANDTHDPSTTLVVEDVWQTEDQRSFGSSDLVLDWSREGEVSLAIDGACDRRPWYTAARGTGLEEYRGTYRVRDSLGQAAVGTFSIQGRISFMGCPLNATPDVLEGFSPNEWPGLPDALNGSIGLTFGPEARGYGTTHVTPDLSNDERPTIGARVEVLPGSVTEGLTVTEDGEAVTLADAPRHSEFTGMWEGPDGSTVNYTAPREGSFAYRLCMIEDETVCSEAATTRFSYFAVGVVPPIEVETVQQNRSFWVGGPASETVDLRGAVPNSATRLADATLFECDGVPSGPRWYEDPCWTESGREKVQIHADQVPISKASPDPNAPGGTWSDTYLWRDRDGSPVARVALHFKHYSAPEAPTTRSDEIWAMVGQTVPIHLDSNDDGLVNTNMLGPVGVETDSVYQHPWLEGITAPHLGEANLGDRSIGVGNPAYAAGMTPGVDRFTYRGCAGWPTAGACSEPTPVTIHVTPDVSAEPDEGETAKDEPTTVEVLSNDTYSDVVSESINAPEFKHATVTLGDVPVGVSAKVNSDRSVTVQGHPGTYRIPYTLRDWTGTSDAEIKVVITDPSAPEPVGPTARDDRAEAVWGKPVAAQVLTNDTYSGVPNVTLLRSTRTPGVKAHVTDSGRVVVTAPKRLADSTVSIQYRLRDESGLTDVATLRVRVAPEVPIIVTGADHAVPHDATTEAATMKTVDASVSGAISVLVGCALIGLSALLLRRRAGGAS